MAERARLVALRKDGATFPVEVSLSPVPTTTGHFSLAVIRDAAGLPSDVARERITQALRQLDDTIHEIRDHVFNVRGRGPKGLILPNGA
jgi:hypothetical protein